MEDSTEQATVAENPVQETTVPTGDTQQEAKAESTASPSEQPKEAGKSFTQDEVNSLITERLSKTYSKYGFSKAEELDEAIGKSQSYSVMKDRYDSIIGEVNSLKAENALLKNGIDPQRYDDVKAYFAGKQIALDSEGLAKEVATHPEWVKRVSSVQPIGSVSNPPDTHVQEKMDREIAEAMGFSGFIR
jgi:hypothetical protein